MGILKRDINTELYKKIIDNIRGLSIDMIDNAQSGHPGVSLGAAPILYSLYAHNLKVDPNDDKWISRDRFILSNGHASALLYSTLFMAGFKIDLEDLRKFRQLNSITPGHPEYNTTPGVDASTGPLGQGIGNAVGIAIGEKYLRDLFGEKIIDFNTFVLCGDGDLMEGISYESMSLAGHLDLNKLIMLYDSNNTTLDGPLRNSFSENIEKRITSMGWEYYIINDSEDITSINETIDKAKTSNKPSFIEIKTTIGKFSINEGTNKVHGSLLSKEDIKSIKEKLNLRDIPFQVSDEAINTMHEMVEKKVRKTKEEWENNILNLEKEKRDLLKYLENNKLPINIKDMFYDLPDDNQESTRVASGKIINLIAEEYPLLIGGSADVANSTYAFIKNNESKSINFGVREHAMGAIGNGLALLGITPFVSTFLSFSDYLKPAIRMSAMMDLGVIYIFSHDSISTGEDGPTHEPVEQLIGLRSIPNLTVYRPADINETIGSYKNILEKRKPAALILGRNKIDILKITSINDTKYGGYILKKEDKKLDAIIIATGEEVNLALKIQNKLQEKGFGIRLVSMPSIECFEMQDDKYKNSTIPKNTKVFVIEAASSYSWYKFTTEEYMFTVNAFGKSGKKDAILNEYGFSEKSIIKSIEKHLV